MMNFGIFGIVTQAMRPGSVPDSCWPRSGHFRAISEDCTALVESEQGFSVERSDGSSSKSQS